MAIIICNWWEIWQNKQIFPEMFGLLLLVMAISMSTAQPSLSGPISQGKKTHKIYDRWFVICSHTYLRHLLDCLLGWSFFNQSCYKVIRLNTSFSLLSASVACAEHGEGSHLLSVHSMAEMGYSELLFNENYQIHCRFINFLVSLHRPDNSGQRGMCFLLRHFCGNLIIHVILKCCLHLIRKLNI